VKDVEEYKAASAAQRGRTVAQNARIEPINARSKTVNDCIDEALDRMDDWHAKCASRRYVVEDDAELRREFGMRPK
jgi:hypothetical protein